MKSFFVLLLTLFFVPSIWAQESSVHLLQEKLENEVTKVVQKIDEQAYVFVVIEPKRQKIALPGTPFSLNEIELQQIDGRVAINSVSVDIFTHVEKLPPAIEKLVQTASSRYGASPRITLNAIPDYVVEAKKKRVEVIEQLGRVDLTSQFLKKNGLLFGLAFLTLATVFFFIIGAVRKSGHKIISTSLKEGVDRISEAIETGGMGGSNLPLLESASEKAESKALAERAETPSADVITGLNVKAVKALLSDCYWGEYDYYASYIWNQLPISMRSEVLNEASYFEDYVSYACTLTPVNLSYHNEPYYLDPLPIHQVGNNELTEYCRKHAEIYRTLSTLRKEALSLTAKERIEISQVTGDVNDKMVEALKKFPETPHRVLKQKMVFKLTSIEEEEEILNMPDLNVEMKGQIPSLGWLLEVEDQKAEEILSGFSAQDLAAAWIGPDNVLEKIKGHLPEKKYALMKSYQESIQPDRESAGYLAIHKQTIAALMSPSESHDEDASAA